MKKLSLFVLLIFIAIGINAVAQDENTDDDSLPHTSKKGFHFGLFIGPYWANKYTASLYDGYGLTYEGERNEFQNSLMNEKIHYEYGGGNGYTDQIALALKVDPGAWKFDESDMPVNMHYNIAFLVGLNAHYAVDDKNAIILNVNAAKLKINGNFTIETLVNPNSNQLSNGVNTFAIVGGEQRLMLQFGYSRILGDNEKCNFFIEGGMNATIAKFDKNLIQINNLTIDLTTLYQNPGTYYYAGQPGYTTYHAKYLRGIGYGAFAGFGLNLTMSPKWTVQLLYNPTYEKISIGLAPRLRFQQACGFRAYYNF